MTRTEIPGKGVIQTILVLGAIGSGLWGTFLAQPHRGELASEVFQIGIGLVCLAGIAIYSALAMDDAG